MVLSQKAIFLLLAFQWYIRPTKLLLLNEKMFKRYDQRMIDAMPQDGVRGYQSIVTTGEIFIEPVKR